MREKISIVLVFSLLLFLFYFQEFWQKITFDITNASEFERENVLKIEK